MSPNITGRQPQTTSENDAHVNGNEPRTQSDQGQELAPDRPPRPVEAVSGVRSPRPRGFAAMNRALVSDIARKGGKAAHSAGTAHEFTSEEAREAGRKGGRATHAKRRQAIEGQQVTPAALDEANPGE
jgi:general stress protein YciG